MLVKHPSEGRDEVSGKVRGEVRGKVRIHCSLNGRIFLGEGQIQKVETMGLDEFYRHLPTCHLKSI